LSVVVCVQNAAGSGPPVWSPLCGSPWLPPVRLAPVAASPLSAAPAGGWARAAPWPRPAQPTQPRCSAQRSVLAGSESVWCVVYVLITYHISGSSRVCMDRAGGTVAAGERRCRHQQERRAAATHDNLAAHSPTNCPFRDKRSCEAPSRHARPAQGAGGGVHDLHSMHIRHGCMVI
jgi:hypothetical protein